MDKRIDVVKVELFEAVSHRITWFIEERLLLHGRVPFENSMDPALEGVPKKEDVTYTSEVIEDRFRSKAIEWLSTNRKPDEDIPVVDFGDLRMIDRREIEDYLGIHQALVHHSSTKDSKPLNIAVFGPPGAGKTFGVSEVVKQISKDAESYAEKPLNFNVGEFTSVGDLTSAFSHIRDECLRGKIPVAFFDEFDSALHDRPFGWLKYFLVPMQDGEFMSEGFRFKLGHCVLVFAGGINRSFEEMNGRLRNQSFCEAKGPDFISRLRAHLNIRGVNKPDGETDHGRYILRRAVILHDLLSRHHGKHKKSCPGALLHSSVAKAFCGVERFKHGVRSILAILNMCDIRPGKTLGPSDLPAKEQLDMHVDAARFLDHLRA